MIPIQLAGDSRMEAVHQAQSNNRAFFHFERPRLNQLFAEAVKYPLVVVCAGAGYGKTSAAHDFVEMYQATTVWMQLSKRDNVGARFWESYTHSLAQVNTPLARAMTKLGFPDTREKLRHYQALLHNLVEMKRRIIVMDDFHCIEEPSVIRFVEECVLQSMPAGTSVFLISRSTPRVNIAGLVYRDQMFNMSESDLRFTENELAQYFRRLNITPQADGMREIMRDTEGWAFAINLIARSYQKAPGYTGYVRNAMKTNIFRLMETEIWDEISECLQNFLIRLSLIDHLSVDLIIKLAGGEEGLINDLEKQSAYVRRDSYINAYIIHPLFLEFLSTKQESLTEEQKRETYAIAGAWCNKNGFRIDALSYHEKIGDYQSIVNIFFELPLQVPENISRFAAPIFDHAPDEVFEKVEFFAEMHMRTCMCQALWQKSLDLVKYYEAKFLKLPEDDIVKKRTLARLYICWAYIRGLMCLTDSVYDFDVYFEKTCKYFSASINPGKLSPHCPGAWIICAGSSEKGIPEKYIAAITRTREHLSRSYISGFMAGQPDLARGELEFYRGNISSAAPFVALALKLARTDKQYGLIHRALFYTLRIAAAQGDFALAEQAMKETKAQLDEAEYLNRFIDYDISLSWYYCFLGMPEKTVDWLKEDFSSYSHPGFIDNFGNQIKARFHYATRNYLPLLLYIEEMKRRESFLFGRIEMLAIEACIHYKMKNKEKALSVFEEAYITAEPNSVLMPFIELGKDMRTLAAAALKEPDGKIPQSWLKDLNRKSASYAKRRTHIITEYRKTYGLTNSVVFSPRESEVITDLSHGLSRTEIAASRGLSVNTVKMVINMLYTKVGAENLADLIRIAVERKLIK
ncbi:MAG: LuxR C-terminal-related transcriptional regulator [Treponema sp.]|jgi:LuxR family maltose regulon positive regulatory protein|nr:LuxR C-terminal-related transcriptional regulator [Treponema sp.]